MIPAHNPLFPALYLYPLNDSWSPKHIALTSAHTKIGRQTSSKTAPGERNGFFDSKVLSRQHAEVWEESGKIFIKDVKSSNGTFINGERLSSEGHESEPFELKSDDIVEFGIDIVGEDNKTIIHHKVAARVVCVFSDQDAQVAARAELHQAQQHAQQQQQQHAQQQFLQQQLAQQAGQGQDGARQQFHALQQHQQQQQQQHPQHPNQQQQHPSGHPGQGGNTFAPFSAQRRVQQAQQGLGGMGAPSSLRPGKSGLSFEVILSRLQGELQKSRETGAELGSLGGAMGEIGETLGGGLPTTLPPFPVNLPPVRPPQEAPPPPAPTVPPTTSTAPPSTSASPEAPQSNTAASLSATTVLDLQTQLRDTQSSLKEHLEKVRALEGVLKEQEGLRREVRGLREIVLGAGSRLEGKREEEARGFDVEEEEEERLRERESRRETEREEEEYREEEEEEDGRSDAGTIVPHELERVEEEDEDEVAEEERREREEEMEGEMEHQKRGEDMDSAEMLREAHHQEEQEHEQEQRQEHDSSSDEEDDAHEHDREQEEQEQEQEQQHEEAELEETETETEQEQDHEETEEEERERRREDLKIGRPRTPEPTRMGMGMSMALDGYATRGTGGGPLLLGTGVGVPRRASVGASSPLASEVMPFHDGPSLSPSSSSSLPTTSLSTSMSTHNTPSASSEILAQLTRLTTQVTSILALTESLEAQHVEAQGTIRSLERKVEGLEDALRTVEARRVEEEEAARLSAETSESTEKGDVDVEETRESLNDMLDMWKKSLEENLSSAQEERERLSRASEEWEAFNAKARADVERQSRPINGDIFSHSHPLQHQHQHTHNGLVTPPSPRSQSSNSPRYRRRRRRSSSGSGREREGEEGDGRERSVSPSRSTSDAGDTDVTLANSDEIMDARHAGLKSVHASGAERSLATPEPSLYKLSTSLGGIDPLLHALKPKSKANGDASTTPSKGKEDATVDDHEGKHGGEGVHMNVQTAVGVLVLGIAAAAVLWRVKHE